MGRVDPASPRRSPPRPVAVLLAVALVVAVVVALARELAPWWSGPPDTGLALLVRGPQGLAWVDVDSGTRREVHLAGRPARSVALVVGTGVVVQSGEPGPVADGVVGYSRSGSTFQVGEADRVLPASSSSVWLVVDGTRGVDGGVALASAYGGWRSRVLPVPPRLQVVGAFDDLLVVRAGRYRSRELMLWDPQASQPIRSLGQTLAVQQVAGGYALVTTGCLSSGCTTATVALTDGATTGLVAPRGWTPVGEATLVGSPGTVAVPVADAEGRMRLAMGTADALELTDAPAPAAGGAVLDAGEGWLVLSAAGGDVVLWRPALDRLPRVELSVDEQVLGVAAAR
jgi:hypothetical protein